MLLPLALVALVSTSAAAHPPLAEPAAAPDKTAESVFVQMKLKTGEKTLKHPGHRMETGEELVLVLTEGKRKHEVTVYLESADNGFKVEVAYASAGKQRLKAEKSVKGRKWAEFKSDDGKSSVLVRVNPGGKRADGIDVPDGDNPLDGA